VKHIYCFVFNDMCINSLNIVTALSVSFIMMLRVIDVLSGGKQGRLLELPFLIHMHNNNRQFLQF